MSRHLYEVANPVAAREIAQLLQDGTDAREIADAYSISVEIVHRINEKSGASHPTETVSDIETQIASMEQQMMEAQKMIRELRDKAHNVAITYHREEFNVIAIHGLGPQPVRAHARQWLRFLKDDGARKLREFIGGNTI
jgi:hypothetical protein